MPSRQQKVNNPMKARPARERIPQTQVLEWLKEHHPSLWTTAELDRAWVWLVANLSGDGNKAVRESIKEFGFIFSRHGGHRLPSGKTGFWGHSCLKPLPFKRHGKGVAAPRPGPRLENPAPSRVDPVREQENEPSMEAEDLEVLAAILG